MVFDKLSVDSPINSISNSKKLCYKKKEKSNRKLFYNDTVQCTSLAHKVSNISFSTQISLLHDRSHSNFRVFSSLFSVQMLQKIMNSSVVESIAEILSVSENTWNKHNFLPSSERALSGISVTIYFQVCCFCLPCLLSWCVVESLMDKSSRYQISTVILCNFVVSCAVVYVNQISFMTYLSYWA